MPRYGTHVGLHGEPLGRVIIVRKSSNTTRVKFPYPDKPGFSPDEVRIDTDTVVEDGGVLWEKYQRTSTATWLKYSGEPRGLLKVQRVYKNVIKASLYVGNGSWRKIEDFHPRDVLFDAGLSWPREKTDRLVTTTPAAVVSVVTPVKPVASTVKGPMFQAPVTVEKKSIPRPGQSPHVPAPSVAAPPVQPADATIRSGQRVGYLRVSNTDQDLARQREALGGVDREFVDHVSVHSHAGRPSLDECLAHLRSGDELVVASIDRLARSLIDLRSIIDQVTLRGGHQCIS